MSGPQFILYISVSRKHIDKNIEVTETLGMDLLNITDLTFYKVLFPIFSSFFVFVAFIRFRPRGTFFNFCFGGRAKIFMIK